MPDPGEPHAPNPEDYECTADWLAALDAYADLVQLDKDRQLGRDTIKALSDPAGAEADRGMHEIEQFLKEQT